MGTTLVAALVHGKKCTVVNVGDSRAYGINRSGIHQISRDHSLVQLMVDRGELTPEVAKTYPGKNFITRAIGTEPIVMCDIYHREVNKGDFILLCCNVGIIGKLFAVWVYFLNKRKVLFLHFL
jgi:protein phosphatase